MGRALMVGWGSMALVACVEPDLAGDDAQGRSAARSGLPSPADSMAATPDRLASVAAAEQGFDDALLVEPPPPVGAAVPVLRLARPQPTVTELRDRLVGMLTVMGIELEPGEAEAWARQAHPGADASPDASITEPVSGVVVTHDARFDDLAVVHTERLHDQRQDTDEVPWSVAGDVMDALGVHGVLDPSQSYEDEIDVSFVRSGVKGPNGHHETWVDEIQFEASARYEGVRLLDAGLRMGITPAHEVSSLRVTRIEVERLGIVEVEASEADLRDSFAEYVASTTSATLDSVVVTERRPVYVLEPGQDSADVEPWYLLRYSLVSTDGELPVVNRSTMVFLSLSARPARVELQLP